MANTRFGKFKVDMAGIRSILKSQAVTSELQGKADSIAASCCASCYADRGKKGHFRSNEVPFNGWTSQGGYTAFGHVSTVNLEGLLYEQKSKILESHNH